MGAFFALIFMVMFGMIIASIIQHFKSKAFKQDIVTPLIHEMFDNAVYDYSKGFSRDRIRATKLISQGSDFRSSDYIKAAYHGIDFEYSDVYIANTTTDGEGHSSTTTYFKGQWIIIKPHRNISGQLYVVDKQLYHSDPQRGGFFKKRDIERVYTESAVFNKEYRVYATIPHEAFYVLTPARIVEFLDIRKDDISFYQNSDEIHIAIYSGKALLEPRLFSSNDDPRYVDEIKETMAKVLSYLNYFDQERG